jgi:hypothetical protein
MNHVLRFDPVSHRYTLNGSPVPSVTQLTGPLTDLSRISPEILERKRALGVYVHECVEAVNDGTLDDGALHPTAAPYVAAYRKFLTETQFVLIAGEQLMGHPTLRYAGRSDLYGLIGAKPSLVDVKTTAALSPAVGPQTAGYGALHAEAGQPVEARYGLQLRPDGTYRFQRYSDPQDWALFVSLLSLHNWRARHNLLEEKSNAL